MKATNIGEIKISGKILWAVAQFTFKESELSGITIIPQEEGIVLMAMDGHSAMVAHDKIGSCSQACTIYVGKSVVSACKKATSFIVSEDGRVWTRTAAKKSETASEFLSSEVVVKTEINRTAVDCVHKILSSPTRECEANESRFYGLTYVKAQCAILNVMKECGVDTHTTKQVLWNVTDRNESALILESSYVPDFIWITMPARLGKNVQEESKKGMFIPALKSTLD